VELTRTATAPALSPESLSMSDQIFSELVEIAKRNGDFRQNYGKIIGAYLYLRSISAIRGRCSLWTGLVFATLSGVAAWLGKHAWYHFH
jgi:hypothetical protein